MNIVVDRSVLHTDDYWGMPVSFQNWLGHDNERPLKCTAGSHQLCFYLSQVAYCTHMWPLASILTLWGVFNTTFWCQNDKQQFIKMLPCVSKIMLRALSKCGLVFTEQLKTLSSRVLIECDLSVGRAHAALAHIRTLNNSWQLIVTQLNLFVDSELHRGAHISILDFLSRGGFMCGGCNSIGPSITSVS